MRCLLVDDEPIALRVLRTHLAQIPDVEIVAECTNAMAALRVLREHDVDLAFLDIEMPGLSGIGLLEALEHPPRIVFTTAHRDYALQGFEWDAVDYLLKPISLPRLVRAVEKYRRLLPTQQSNAPEAPTEAPTLTLRAERRTVRVPIPDIRYIESLSDYVKIHTITNEYTTKLRIRDLEEELSPHGFIRIHRSFVVALAHVEAFSSSEINVGQQHLPISRTYKKATLEHLQRLFL